MLRPLPFVYVCARLRVRAGECTRARVCRCVANKVSQLLCYEFSFTRGTLSALHRNFIGVAGHLASLFQLHVH